MDVIEVLKGYKNRLDPLLKDYFSRKVKKVEKNNVLAAKTAAMIADFTLAGGKRIRPALVYYGYLAAGGKEEEKILEASMSIELAHIFLLIHDDIIDKDEKRHGVATLHERYKKIGRKLGPEKDETHFGNSMAMLAGDMAYSMANEILFSSQFDPAIILRALKKMQDIVYTIVPGEMLDVIMEIRGRSDEKEVLQMYKDKTSSYSFEGPLHLGAILAGADDPKFLSEFTAYAMPLGKAFQIRDDIIGLFGTEKKIGKPIGSDVIEGKQTILLVKALKDGSVSQKNILKKYLGKKDLTKDELEEFRTAIRDTGALEYSQDLSSRLVAEAKVALSKIDFQNEEAREFLEGLADYIIVREV